ncbi:hypothetical protein [Streptomyces sp. PT12]|uniref:hypothetical protein n=1 Tax=Streptomyces sp. PT12 TaxID=1510197 RepID=UPI000DE50BC6|nr:hypothetical protein [Streptomyces sp. PT12]RBM22047.1 hypothetical protein DEH69_04420 [Streptomyces sp. PT12]
MNDAATTLASDPAGVFAFLIVVVWRIAATWRARMLASREDEFRRLAVKYGELLEDNTEILRRYTDELTETRKSVASMERMMRELD